MAPVPKLPADVLRRVPFLTGVAGLLLMLGGLGQAFSPSTSASRVGAWWIASLTGAGVALVCGLIVHGRARTLVLVVPALAYLVLALGPL